MSENLKAISPNLTFPSVRAPTMTGEMKPPKLANVLQIPTRVPV